MGNESDRVFVTKEECVLRTENLNKSVDYIVEGIDDLRQLKDVLNPAFASLEQIVKSHLEQDTRDKERKRDRWSPLQITILAITAISAAGMFVVALVK